MTSKLDSLIHFLSKLPSVGNKTAKRYAVHILKNRDNVMIPLAQSIHDAAHSVQECEECGNYDDNKICYICLDDNRNNKILCVIETIADLWTLEDSRVFDGKYHVLGGNLSSINDQDPSKLNIPQIIDRVRKDNVEEVIIATSTSIDGQTTAFYITEQLKPLGIKVTRLASGIPIGGELNYLDEGTILASFKARRNFL